MPKTIFYLLKGDFRLESNDAQPARTPFQVERPRGLAAALLPMWVVAYNQGYLFGGPHNKDHSLLGSILGSPYFGNLPCVTFSEKV